MFIETLAPSFVKSADNPNGVDEAGVAGVQKTILDDRYAWLTGLLADFLNLDDYLGKRVSEETVRATAEAAMREVIGQSNLQYAQTEGRTRIEQDTRT